MCKKHNEMTEQEGPHESSSEPQLHWKAEKRFDYLSPTAASSVILIHLGKWLYLSLDKSRLIKKDTETLSVLREPE